MATYRLDFLLDLLKMPRQLSLSRQVVIMIVMVVVVIDVLVTSQPPSSPRDEPQPCFNPTNNIQVFTSNDSSCGSLQPILQELADHRRKLDKLDHVISTLDAASSDNTSNNRPQDCLEVQRAGFTDSGAYMIYPDGDGEPFRAYCDMTTSGGGWTLLQRRETGIIDFYRTWAEYKDGFGDILREHWLGNERIRRLASQKRYELRVDLAGFDGSRRYALYSMFYIEAEEDDYKLWLGSYGGTAGDSLTYHNGKRFTTKYTDNDEAGYNCARVRHGAWWYNNCDSSNLNGRYYSKTDASTDHDDCVKWNGWIPNRSMKESEMKIRPV